MACAADAMLCASASGACAAVVLVPALPCVHAPFSPALWLLDAALLTPLICCAFAAPTTAMAVVSAPHWVEFDEQEGKFVGVEDDTLLFDEHGALDESDVYDPREDAEEEAWSQLRRRSSDAQRAQAPQEACAQQQQLHQTVDSGDAARLKDE